MTREDRKLGSPNLVTLVQKTEKLPRITRKEPKAPRASKRTPKPYQNIGKAKSSPERQEKPCVQQTIVYPPWVKKKPYRRTLEQSDDGSPFYSAAQSISTSTSKPRMTQESALQVCMPVFTTGEEGQLDKISKVNNCINYMKSCIRETKI